MIRTVTRRRWHPVASPATPTRSALATGAREADHDRCIPTAIVATVVRLGVGFPHVIRENPQICARRAGHRERSRGPWPHRPTGYGAGLCPGATATSPSQSAYP